MPIYEYIAAGDDRCSQCRSRFEVRQRMNERPLKVCPECGARVRKLISSPFVVREESPGEDDILDGYSHEDPDQLGIEDDYAGCDWQ
ncbi:MAG: FmdB family zinc ribbon protein [Dehalococcoidia bacterium]